MSKRRAGSDIPTGEELLKFAEVCKEETDLPDWWEDHATGPGTDGASDGETLEEEADRRAHEWDDLEPEER